MTNENPNPKRDRLAELEAMEREQDAAHEKRMSELLDELIGHQLGAQPEAVAGQLASIADRLLALPGLTAAIQSVHDDQFDWDHRLDPITGELVVAITIGEFTYHEANGDLIVQHEAGGRIEWTRIHGDGTLERPWRPVAPPKSRSALN